MKKKVVIEKVPSSKKKVVIEGLPKADVGRQQPFTIPGGGTFATGPDQPTGDFDPYKEMEKSIMTREKRDRNQRRLQSFKDAWKNTKMGVPHFYPLVGNRYLQEAVMDFNDALTFASNIGKAPKDITIPSATYNPYANIYWIGAYGGELPIASGGMQTGFQWNPIAGAALGDYDESGNLLGVAGFDENGNPISKRPLQQLDKNGNPIGRNFSQPTFNLEQGQFNMAEDSSSQGTNPYVTVGSIMGTVGKLGSTTVKGIKGAALEKGIDKANKEAMKQQVELQKSAFASDYAPPFKERGEGFLGENFLAADGMQIRQIGGYGEPNVEVEGKEGILLPNGFSQEIQGKSHAEGGIPLNLPSGTKIFSEKLKVPVKFLKELIEINPQYAFLKNIKLPEKGMMSYADLAKKFETKKYVDLLNSPDADPIQKTTAQLMINKNNQALEAIFALQEQNKIGRAHV